MKPRRRAAAREAALGVVARRMVSETELTAGLARKGYSATEIDDAATLLRSYRYLDDEALAAAVVREAARTGRGPLWVRQTLARRGVSEALTRSATAAAVATAPADARNALTRRFGEREPGSPAERRKVARFLMSRGFTAELAARLAGGDE